MNISNLKISDRMNFSLQIFLRPHIISSKRINFGMVLTAYSLLYILIFTTSVCGYYISSAYFGSVYPYNTFLINPVYKFGDYYEMLRLTNDLNPYLGEVVSAYPPLGNLFMWVWTLFPGVWGLIAFNVLAALLFYFYIYNLARGLNKIGIILFFISFYICAYPVIFCIDRGNSEIYVALSIGFFLLYYNSRSSSLKSLSIVALSIAISLKIVPIVFCSVYIKDRRWRDLFSVMFSVVFINLFSTSLFKGDLLTNAQMFWGSINNVQNKASSDLVYAAFSTNITTGLHLCARILDSGKLVTLVKDFNYTLIIIIFSLVNVKLWFGKYRLGESAVILAALGCLLPSISADYKLCVVHVAGIYMIFNSANSPLRYRLTNVILLSLISAPKNWFIIFEKDIRGDIGISSILNPILLCVLIVCILYRSEIFNDKISIDVYGKRPREYDEYISRILKGSSIKYAAVSGIIICTVVANLIIFQGQSFLKVGTFASTDHVIYNKGDILKPLFLPNTNLNSRMQLTNFNVDIDFVASRNAANENIFETSGNGDGLRLEYANGEGGKGTLVLVHGRAEAGVEVHHISHQMLVDTKYNLKLVINTAKNIKIFLDGIEVIHQSPSLDSLFHYDGFRLGSKFDSKQPFQSFIQLNSISGTYGMSNNLSPNWSYYQIALAINLIIIILSFNFLRSAFKN